ncbi:hypothetical protein [Parasitella parasitica]|uniref:Disease resistance R13L4/SHOC-2-like LRR domain-containing protein n=1 Tax=Parasitella parasitica TaxID=35722 RepID=A0A0B7N777_9FUNG|nr:hypothetical protein [Parasitella parasitica]
MVLSYLEGGKSLEGVASSSVDVVYNESSLSFSSASSLATYSSMNDNQEQHQLILRRLGLSSQGFVHHILKAKSDHQQLWLTKILDASRNQITSIPPALEHFTNLTLLNLCCNNISIIPEAILCLHQLQQLYLSENQIVAIPEAMPLCLTQLVVLNLDSNYIKSLPDSVGQWKKLRELRLGSEYGGNIIEFLPDTVCEMQALVELDLSFNALQNIGILQGLRKLTYLNLSHNRLQYLPLFDDCFQLTTVDISDNLIRTIPYEAANSVLRLMHCELQVLNLSNNRLDIIPTELLDQAQTHVIIHGNPLTSHQQQNEGDTDEQGNQDPLPHENNTHQIVQDLIQTAMPMVDYYRNTAGTPATRNEEPAMQGVHAEQVGGRDQDRRPPYLLHSLREITLRDIAVEDTQLLISKVPEHLAQDIRENLRLCPQCHTPFLHEWVSTPQLKTYQGHRSVVRQIRFCSTSCWMSYKEMLQQEALAAQSEVHLRQQQENALAYIAQHSNVLQPGSFEWVVAASLAATAQDEQADLLANATMMM